MPRLKGRFHIRHIMTANPYEESVLVVARSYYLPFAHHHHRQQGSDWRFFVFASYPCFFILSPLALLTL